MLVLTRHFNESILIGDDIVITIVGIDRGRVKLGITAPGHVPILRKELAERIAAGMATIEGRDVTIAPAQTAPARGTTA